MGYQTGAAPVRQPVHVPDSTSAIGWQPKFAPDASALAASLPDDGLDLTGLVGALGRQPASGTPRSCRVAEFTQAAEPGQTAVADYLRRAPDGGLAELWVLGACAGQTRRLSEVLGSAASFATADLSAPAAIDLGGGLLRACACDLVVIDARTTVLTAASWALLRRLLLPRGLVLVRHPGPEFVHPGPGWSKVGTGPHGGVWSAPPGLFDDGAAELEGPRWVIADQTSLGGLWAGQAGRGHAEDCCAIRRRWLAVVLRSAAGDEDAARDRLLRRPRRPRRARAVRAVTERLLAAPAARAAGQLRSAGHATRHPLPGPAPRAGGRPAGTGVPTVPPDGHHPPRRPGRLGAAGGAAVGRGPVPGPRA